MSKCLVLFPNRDNFGGWAAKISKRYKYWKEGKAVLSSEEEEELNELSSLGFEFKVSSYGAKPRSWEENFEALALFRAAHGHTQVPRQYMADIRLGLWASTQRSEYKLLCEGKPSKLTPERYEKLEDAGFVWELPSGPGRRN